MRPGLFLKFAGTSLIAGALSTISVALAGPEPLPEIRTHERNRVPACVTPDRLMNFLTDRNARLDPRFRTIASHYKQHGEANRIRWDYAFFQMVLETNYLIFKNAAGQGDVNPRQNNFAGIGTTGGGVPGDAFPDVSTGVLAQMQHLTAYSGEHVDNPVARRTREKQDDIIQRSRMLRRAVTFRDLARRWAADSRYGTSIEAVARRFRDGYCNGRDAMPADVVSAPESREQRRNARLAKHGRMTASATVSDAPASMPEAVSATDEERGDRKPIVQASLPAPPLAQSPAIARPPTTCRVYTASFGGRKNLLIRAIGGTELQFTALQVLDGQEEFLGGHFIRVHAKGGDILDEFPDRDAALARAFELCPAGPRPAR